MEIIGLDLHKRESPLFIMANDGTITDRRIATSRERFTPVFGGRPPGRILLEAVPSPDGGFGETFGSVGGLIDGLASASGIALLDGAARRLRALTAYDRACVTLGEERCESSRVPFSMETRARPLRAAGSRRRAVWPTV